MQEGNKSLSMLRNVQFERDIFTLICPVSYITVDIRKLVSDLLTVVPLWHKADL